MDNAHVSNPSLPDFSKIGVPPLTLHPCDVVANFNFVSECLVSSFQRKSKATTTTSSNSTNVPSNPPRQASNLLCWPRKARNSLRRLRQACNVLRGLRRLNIYHLDIDGAGSARRSEPTSNDTTSPGRIRPV
jgi:hypothetical protein